MWHFKLLFSWSDRTGRLCGFGTELTAAKVSAVIHDQGLRMITDLSPVKGVR